MGPPLRFPRALICAWVAAIVAVCAWRPVPLRGGFATPRPLPLSLRRREGWGAPVATTTMTTGARTRTRMVVDGAEGARGVRVVVIAARGRVVAAAAAPLYSSNLPAATTCSTLALNYYCNLISPCVKLRDGRVLAFCRVAQALPEGLSTRGPARRLIELHLCAKRGFDGDGDAGQSGGVGSGGGLAPSLPPASGTAYVVESGSADEYLEPSTLGALDDVFDEEADEGGGENGAGGGVAIATGGPAAAAEAELAADLAAALNEARLFPAADVVGENGTEADLAYWIAASESPSTHPLTEMNGSVSVPGLLGKAGDHIATRVDLLPLGWLDGPSGSEGGQQDEDGAVSVSREVLEQTWNMRNRDSAAGAQFSVPESLLLLDDESAEEEEEEEEVVDFVRAVGNGIRSDAVGADDSSQRGVHDHAESVKIATRGEEAQDDMAVIAKSISSACPGTGPRDCARRDVLTALVRELDGNSGGASFVRSEAARRALDSRRKYGLGPEIDDQRTIIDISESASFATPRLPGVSWPDIEGPPRSDASSAADFRQTAANELAFLDLVSDPGDPIVDFGTPDEPIVDRLGIKLPSHEERQFAQLRSELLRRGELAAHPAGLSDAEMAVGNARESTEEGAMRRAIPEVDWSSFNYSEFDGAEARNESAVSASTNLFGDIDETRSPGFARLLRRLRGVSGAAADAASDTDNVSGLDAAASDPALKDLPLDEHGQPDEEILMSGYIANNYSDPRYGNMPPYMMTKSLSGGTPGGTAACLMGDLDDDVLAVPSDDELRQRFPDHVGFDVWGKYGREQFEDADNRLWEDDVLVARAAQRLDNLTDLYLQNHRAVLEEVDTRDAAEKTVACAVSGNWSGFNESVPLDWTPDKHRGVVYTDEIIEMKSKRSLLPEYGDPAELYGNDTFSANPDIESINTIGTVRSQVNWLPEAGEEAGYAIDPDVVRRIQPLLDFVNELAVLKSTKNNVLVFEYRGILRHLIGIQAHMTSIARDCFRRRAEADGAREASSDDGDANNKDEEEEGPLVRVRLVCDRGMDKYDHNGMDE